MEFYPMIGLSGSEFCKKTSRVAGIRYQVVATMPDTRPPFLWNENYVQAELLRLDRREILREAVFL
jgi:hypothetical protein